jgi:hypothetical protein
MKNEKYAGDFFRLHPVKKKGPMKNENPILFVRQDPGKGFLPISIRIIYPIQSPVERNKNLAKTAADNKLSTFPLSFQCRQSKMKLT